MGRGSRLLGTGATAERSRRCYGLCELGPVLPLLPGDARNQSKPRRAGRSKNGLLQTVLALGSYRKKRVKSCL